MRRVIGTAAMLCAAVGVAFAESPPGLYRPFGISPGQAVATLDRAAEVEPGLWSIAAPPQPHELLSQYTVRTNGRKAVCEMAGYAPAPQADIDQVVGTLRRQISEVAGEPAFLPFTTDPRIVRAWFWRPRATGGAPQAAPSRVELLHVRYSGYGDAARVTVQFDQICGAGGAPNPFR